MRYPPGRREATRDAILAAAGRLLRTAGPAGVTIKRVMGALDLTHGGFYAHFPSRAALIAETVTRAGQDTLKQLWPGHAPPDSTGLRQVVGRYLGRQHRAAVADGCPLPSTIGAVAGEPEIAAVFAATLERYRAVLGVAGGQTDVLLALLVGGLQLARAELDPGRADAVLRACRIAVLQLLEGPDLDQRPPTLGAAKN
jgi:AcrR family transcriptional regulator